MNALTTNSGLGRSSMMSSMSCATPRYVRRKLSASALPLAASLHSFAVSSLMLWQGVARLNRTVKEVAPVGIDVIAVVLDVGQSPECALPHVERGVVRGGHARKLALPGVDR